MRRAILIFTEITHRRGLSVMHRIILFLATFCVSCLLAGTASAQNNNDQILALKAASTALNEGRYDAALPHVKRAAESGLVIWQYNLAIMYRDGLGVSPSRAIYRKWMEAAAAQGYADALFSLGADYDAGRGVTRDLRKALDYYERAAAAGDSKAAYNSGQIYLLGEGVILPNQFKAIRLIEQAAAAKEGAALMTLGYVYETGLTGVQDIECSRDYYYRAEAEGMPTAAEAIDRLKRVASDLAFNTMLANDHVGAVAAFQKLCNEADMEACAHYGNYLANGAPGVPADLKGSLVPLKASCDADNMYGCKYLADAVMMQRTEAEEADRDRVAAYYETRCASAYAIPENCFNLAVMYYYGRVEGGKTKAREFAGKACSGGYKEGCSMVRNIDSRKADWERQKAERAREEKYLAARQAENFRPRRTASYGSYSSGSTSSGSSSSGSYTSSSSAQDNADFNAFINKVNSYGTGYSATCRTGNPYC